MSFHLCDAFRKSNVQKLPVDIDGQIRFAESTLASYVEDFIGPRDLKNDVRVILVGHSLGAFLSMEMLQRFRNVLRKDGQSSRRYRLTAAIGVFPGLVHLVQGTMPQKLAVRLLHSFEDNLANVVDTVAGFGARCCDSSFRGNSTCFPPATSFHPTARSCTSNWLP